MSDKTKMECIEPLSDDECLELMYLFRVARNGDDTPEEMARLKDLFRRHHAHKEASKKETK